MRPILLACLLLLAHLSFTQPILHVTPTGSGDGSGTSWTNALPGVFLAERLATAQAGTQFQLAAGTYLPTDTPDRTASFSLAAGVSVYGGFNGTETALTDRRNGTNETVLSGNIGDPADPQDNSIHVVTLPNTTGKIILDGLTIRDGWMRPQDGSSGAGLVADLSSTTLTLAISNCQFLNNTIHTGLTGGGGIGLTTRSGGHCELMLRQCNFSDNEAGYGGAFMPQTLGGTFGMLVEDCVFSGNVGSFESGAVSTRWVSNAAGSTLAVRRCSFVDNVAFTKGGALTTGPIPYLLENCVFDRNIAPWGGAVDASGANATYRNCLFSNNTASGGGAIFSVSEERPTSQTFVNCHLVQNTASGSGGAFYNLLYGGPGSYTTAQHANQTYLTNCLIWDNTAPDAPVFKTQQDNGFSNVPTTNYSLLQTLDPQVFVGTGNMSVNPLLINAAENDFRPRTGSPAIDAGDPSTPGDVPTDLAGQVRSYYGRIDIGAYEYNCPPTVCIPFAVVRR